MDNAKTWYDDAKGIGFEVNKTPKANAVAVYAAGNHLAFVESVEG